MIKYNIFENGNLILEDKKQKSYNFKKTETLFIFHGLFGRGRNWQTFSKILTKNEDLIVITVDLRNHGGNEFKKNQHEGLNISQNIINFLEKKY